MLDAATKAIHRGPANEDERAEILTIVRDQFIELHGDAQVTCADCKRKVPVRFMYHCYFCGLWFCTRCAGVHFGAKQEPAK